MINENVRALLYQQLSIKRQVPFKDNFPKIEPQLNDITSDIINFVNTAELDIRNLSVLYIYDGRIDTAIALSKSAQKFDILLNSFFTLKDIKGLHGKNVYIRKIDLLYFSSETTYDLIIIPEEIISSFSNPTLLSFLDKFSKYISNRGMMLIEKSSSLPNASIKEYEDNGYLLGKPAYILKETEIDMIENIELSFYAVLEKGTHSIYHLYKTRKYHSVKSLEKATATIKKAFTVEEVKTPKTSWFVISNINPI